MSFFNATIEAALAGKIVRAAALVRFDFTSQTKRIWPGFGNLSAGGQTWQGIGEYGSVEGIEFRSDTAAPPLICKLSGISSDLVAKAVASETEVKGNPMAVYLQFFDDAWAPLDSPVAIAAAIMDQMTFDATGPSTRNLTLTAEGPFARRGAAAFARYTDRDQQGRFPGDRGCEYVPQLVNATFTWPHF